MHTFYTALVNILKIVFDGLKPYASSGSNVFYGLFYLTEKSLVVKFSLLFLSFRAYNYNMGYCMDFIILCEKQSCEGCTAYLGNFSRTKLDLLILSLVQ